MSPPVVMGTSVVEATGAILAVYEILGAYNDRLKTGKGHKVESCLLNVAMKLQLEAYSARMLKRPEKNLVSI